MNLCSIFVGSALFLLAIGYVQSNDASSAFEAIVKFDPAEFVNSFQQPIQETAQGFFQKTVNEGKHGALRKAMIGELVGGTFGAVTTVFEAILARLWSTTAIFIQGIVGVDLALSGYFVNAGLPIFDQLVPITFCGFAIAKDAGASGLANMLLARMAFIGPDSTKTWIYIDQYKAYSSSAIDALSSIDSIIQTSNIWGLANSTCSAYADGARGNLAGQAKQVADFYKTIPAEVLKDVQPTFVKVINNFRIPLGNNTFTEIFANITIPRI